jgi:hypothetical protein
VKLYVAETVPMAFLGKHYYRFDVPLYSACLEGDQCAKKINHINQIIHEYS